MINYSEKRDYYRMDVECAARYRPDNAKHTSTAIVNNISGSGLALRTSEPLVMGTRFAIQVLPGKSITPPLSAYAEVIRCETGEPGEYLIACTISKILSDDEIGPDFP